MNFDQLNPRLSCLFLEGTPEIVTQAFHDLNRDMNSKFVHVFLDKLERYATKPDRALFLARYQERFIGFACIINYSPPPENVAKTSIELLKTFACSTGLMVLPEFRRQGVASGLVRCWEKWAAEKSRNGVWLVTRKMAQWYWYHFHYSVHGIVTSKGTKKNILIKGFPKKFHTETEPNILHIA